MVVFVVLCNVGILLNRYLRSVKAVLAMTEHFFGEWLQFVMMTTLFFSVDILLYQLFACSWCTYLTTLVIC